MPAQLKKNGEPRKIRKDRIDMTGRVYGNVTVLAFSHIRYYESGQQHYLWKVRCSCGAEWLANGGSLRRGVIQRCTRCRDDRARARLNATLRDRSGLKFRATTLLFLRSHGRGREYPLSLPIYAARCDCGTEFDCHVLGDRCVVDCGCGIGHRVPWITVDGRTQSMSDWAVELGVTRQCINQWCDNENFDIEAAIRWRLGGKIGPNPNGGGPGRPKKNGTLHELPHQAVSFIEGALVVE